MKTFIVGIEIGGTKQQIALGSPEGEIFRTIHGSVDVKEGGKGIRRWLKANMPGFIRDCESDYGQVSAIGCGFGGPIDTSEGRVLRSMHVEGWQDFPIKAWFEDTFSLPTTVENDANAATWGEYRRGFGQGCQHFFYTNIGSGIGGGFVFNGELYNGQGVGAGEFGHTYVPDWTSADPGAAKEVENLCSGWSIQGRLREPSYVPESADLFQRFSGDLASVTPADLADSARNGDVFALKEIDRVAHSLGIGLANVLGLSSVERIAIGGGVSKMGDLLIDRIRKYTAEYVFISSKERYEISKCALGDAIVLVGAILLAAGMHQE